MGWDGIFKTNLIPWDGTIYKTFRPIPSHGTKFFKKRPMGWDGMGWDGMGWDCPIPRGALIGTSLYDNEKKIFMMKNVS